MIHSCCCCCRCSPLLPGTDTRAQPTPRVQPTKAFPMQPKCMTQMPSPQEQTVAEQEAVARGSARPIAARERAAYPAHFLRNESNRRGMQTINKAEDEDEAEAENNMITIRKFVSKARKSVKTRPNTHTYTHQHAHTHRQIEYLRVKWSLT